MLMFAKSDVVATFIEEVSEKRNYVSLITSFFITKIRQVGYRNRTRGKKFIQFDFLGGFCALPILLILHYVSN